MSEARFCIDAGAAVRGALRRSIEAAAFSYGLDIDTKESKGFLSSVYFFTVRGPDSTLVRDFSRAIERWLANYEAQP